MGACCTKTLGQDPGQSAARGREIAPHGCQGVESNVTDSKLKKYTELGALVTILRTGAVRLVMAEFVVRQYYHTTEPMPCCQDLPEEAFLHIEDLTDEDIAKLTIFVLSYCWITPEHPDPERYHLKDVARILEAFLRCPPDGGMGELRAESFRSQGFALGGRGQPVVVFWDWCALPQDKPKGRRIAEETAVFERGLRTVNSWYAHEFTIVLLLTTLPEGAARASYDGSGWTTFERSVAGIITPGPRLLDVDARARAKLDELKDGSLSSDEDFRDFAFTHKDSTRGAPREPQAFNTLIQGKRVTNGADVDEVLRPKYEETFNEVIAEAGAIILCYCDLSTEAAHETLRVAQARCPWLRRLSLAGNGEAYLSLEEVAASCKALVHLDLRGCYAVSGNLSTLGEHMQQLEVLNLYDTGVLGDLSTLGEHMQQLEVLHLSNTKIEGELASLGGLKRLNVLNLSHTGCGGDVAGLLGLPQLTHLTLSGTRVEGDIAGLAGLGALESLGLPMTEVSGDVAGLAGLGALRTLCLDYTAVSGSVSALKGLKHLQDLSFEHTRVNKDLHCRPGENILQALERARAEDEEVATEAAAEEEEKEQEEAVGN